MQRQQTNSRILTVSRETLRHLNGGGVKIRLPGPVDASGHGTGGGGGGGWGGPSIGGPSGCLACMSEQF